MVEMGKIIGIDLGTSNSAAAAMIGGKPTIIQAAEGTSVGGKAFPSVVGFTRDGQLIVGEPARRQMVSNPEGTVIAAKRKMGTDFKFRVYGRDYTPQQVSSFILQKIKRDSEAFLGDAPRVEPELVLSLPESARAEQPGFQRTGALHATALFAPDGRMLVAANAGTASPGIQLQ